MFPFRFNASTELARKLASESLSSGTPLPVVDPKGDTEGLATSDPEDNPQSRKAAGASGQQSELLPQIDTTSSAAKRG